MGDSHEKARSRLCLAALFAALALFFSPALTGTFFFRDAFNLFYPYKAVMAGYLRNLSVCAWNHWETMGSPFVGELAPGWFYPGNILWMVFEPEHAFRLFIVLHYFLAAGLMWRWLGELKLTSVARFVGALSYTLSGYVLSQNGLPDLLATAAWLPGSILFTTRLAKNHDVQATSAVTNARVTSAPRNLTFLSITLSLPFLCGRAEGSAMNAVACFIFFLFMPTGGQGGIRRFGRAMVTFTAAGNFALCLSMAQFLPSLELGSLSAKGAGFGLDEAMLWSFHPARLLEFLRSAPWGDFWPEQTYSAWDRTGWPGYYPFALTEYLGLGALIGSVIYLVRAPRARAAAFIAGLTVIIILSFGKFTPVFAVVYRLVPGMTIFRYPEKLMLLAALMLSAGGAAGAERLLAWLNEFLPDRVAGRWSRPVAAIVFATFIFIDLFASNRWVVPYSSRGIFSPGRSADAMLQKAAGGRSTPGSFRVMRDLPDPTSAELSLVPGDNPLERRRRWERETMIPNFNFISGYEFLTGYTAAATADFDRVMRSGISVKLMELFNVRYIISPTGPDLPGLSGLETVGAEPRYGFRLLRLPNTFPRAYLVGWSLRVPKMLDRLDLIRSHDFSSSVLLEDVPGLPPVDEESDLPMTPAVVVKYEPERVEIETDAPVAAWLVLSDSFYPGWRAGVDGRDVPIFRANYLVRAARVPAGRHTVVFEYRPLLLRVGMAVSAVAWLLAAAIVFRGLSLRRSFR